jgi:hypothetical protein
MPQIVLFFKDDRSPLSSAESGDESSGVESPGPNSNLNNSHVQEQIVRQQQKHQHEDYMNSMSTAGLGSVLYPAAALANLPQEVLLSLVQAGHLQVQDEGKTNPNI